MVLDPLLQTLLELSPAGVLLGRPVYAPTGGDLLDLTYEHLNPAAQRLLGLPAQPGQSVRALYPAAAAQELLSTLR